MNWIVEPGALRSGSVAVPGDKSITHRAILFGMLARGETVLRGANAGGDAHASLTAAVALGAGVERTGDRIVIRGTGGSLSEPADVIDCGNSGTTLRLLAGVLAGQPLVGVLTGDASLRRRPVDRVVAPLREMGARLTARAGDTLPPLVVQGARLSGRTFDTATPSAQVATCIVIAGLAAEGETSVRTAAGVRDHTTRMLGAFGIDVAVEELGQERRIRVRGPQVATGIELRIPGDPSAAAFFFAIAAATPGLSIVVEGVSVNPTRLGFLEVLRSMGAAVEVTRQGSEAGEPVGDIRVTGPDALRAADVPAAAIPAMVDEVPAWAVAASLARGTSRITGAQELRHKESDRLRTVAENLRGLGVEVEESSGGLSVTGLDRGPRGGEVRARGDHRIAMAFAILGTRARGPVSVDDAGSVATSFPGFAAALRGLGGRLEERERR